MRAADAATEIIPALRKEICKLLIEGRSDREISRRLGFSLRSLQGHVAQLKKEYGAAHRLQLGYLLGLSAASEGGVARIPAPREPDRDSPGGTTSEQRPSGANGKALRDENATPRLRS